MSVPSSSLRLTMLFLPSNCFLLIDFRPLLFSGLVVAFPHCMIGFLLPSSVLWPCRSPHIQCFVHLSHLFSSVFFSLSTAWSLQRVCLVFVAYHHALQIFGHSKEFNFKLLGHSNKARSSQGSHLYELTSTNCPWKA